MFDFDEIMKNGDLINEQNMLGVTISPRARFVFKKSVQWGAGHTKCFGN